MGGAEEITMRDLRIVADRLSVELGVSAEVVFNKKNNNVEKAAITITKQGSNLAPVIYPPYGWEEMNEDELVRHFKECFYNSIPDEDFNVSLFTDWQKAKGKLYPILIGAASNEGAELVTVPLTGDLMIAFIVEVSGVFGNGTVKVSPAHMALWRVDTKELLKVAKENIKGTSKIADMFSVMSNILEGNPGIAGGFDLEEIRNDTFMYVASNKDGIYGAGILVDDESIQRFHEMVGNFFILPSSVHELIFVPDSGDPDMANNLLEMVKQVNATEVPEQDVLTNEVYYFDGKEISVVASELQIAV